MTEAVQETPTTAAAEGLTPETAAIVARVFGEEAPAADDAPAPDAPATEAPAEATPAPAPEEPKMSARVLAARRSEERAARERAALAEQKAALASKEAELAEMTKIAELAKAAKSSPSKVLELLGYEPKTFLETLANENEPAAVAARAVEQERAEREKLKAEIDDLRKTLETTRQAETQAKNARLAAQAEEAFVEHVAAKADVYPNLVEQFTPEEIVRESYRILTEVIGHDGKGRPVTRLEAYRAEHKKDPEDEEIAEYLESEAMKRAESRNAWRARIGKNAPQPSQGTPNGQTAKAQPETGPGPRTLTARDVSERATGGKPWSQEAADEESLRIIASARKPR